MQESRCTTTRTCKPAVAKHVWRRTSRLPRVAWAPSRGKGRRRSPLDSPHSIGSPKTSPDDAAAKMALWRDFSQVLGPRAQEVEEGRILDIARFDNGLFLQLQPFRPPAIEVGLAFLLLEDPAGTVLMPSATGVRDYMWGRNGYRWTTVVKLPGDTREGGTPEDSVGFNSLRFALGATAARLYVAAAPLAAQRQGVPSRFARAEFTAVGHAVGVTGVDYTGVARKVLAALDDVRQFLVDAIARSPVPPIR